MPVFDADRIHSLRLTIVLYVVLPLVAVLGVAGYLAHRGLETWVEARMQEEVRIVARAIQEPLARSLRRDRPGAVDQLLESAFRLSEVYAVQVYGPDGEEVAAIGVPVRPEGSLDERIESREEGGEYGRMAGRDVYSYFASLSDPGGRPIGLLQVSRRRSDFERTFARLRLQSGGLLLGGTLLVIGLVMVGHHRSVGRHLRGLADDMARIEAGDHDHRASTEEAPRETVALAHGLNSMLDSLADARREIERHQDAQSTLEHRLQRTEKMAAIGRLAAGVAHELGSPLSVVDGKAQRLLRRDDLDGEIGERLAEIRRQVRRMEGIVNRLLEFGRRKEARRAKVRVGALVRGAVASVEETLKMSGTSLEVSGPNDEDPEILVDRGQMIRALANLLRNAAQASPGGRVRLSWSGEDGSIRFVVEDDGPGIDPEARERIFEPFFTTRAVGEGAGLGLAVVHGTALDHGGRVEVGESSLGGARFDLFVSREGPR